MFDEGTRCDSVLAFARPLAVRDHAPYPPRGRHTIALSPVERRRIRAASSGLTLAGFVRRAVLRAAGLPECGVEVGPVERRAPVRVPYFLSRSERGAVDARLSGRDLSAWVRDAVRFDAGLRNTWSECANALLRRGFRRLDLEVLLRALPGRTPSTIYYQTERLGLDTRLGEERTTIHGAAALAGVDDDTVRRMFARQGRPVAAMAGKTSGAQFRYGVVRVADVVAAVTEDSRVEDVQTAADRLRRAPAALRKALLRAGHERPLRNHRWRLAPEVFDAAAKTIRGKGGR